MWIGTVLLELSDIRAVRASLASITLQIRDQESSLLLIWRLGSEDRQILGGALRLPLLLAWSLGV